MTKVRNPFAAPENSRNALTVKTGIRSGVEDKKRPIIVEIQPHGPIVEIAPPIIIEK